MKNVLMIAAENDALLSGKVGGIGDVVRDTPPALAKNKVNVHVITPSYGLFHLQLGAELEQTFYVNFQKTQQSISLYKVIPKNPEEGVTHWVLEHPLFAVGGKGAIYCNDPADRPFATDATKFALFCNAVCQAIIQQAFGKLDIIHCHDWHAAITLFLRRFDPHYEALKAIKTVYTIHNLALQGIRPFAGDVSSLNAWFPHLNYDPDDVRDPRWLDCINPMAIGIRFADQIHTVSPTYATEIQTPSAVWEKGYYGGEGLENDLKKAANDQRLHGILNGCTYPAKVSPEITWQQFIKECRQQTLHWIGQKEHVKSTHYLAMERMRDWAQTQPEMLITSVGRITDQKVRLLQQITSHNKPALHQLLDTLESGQLLLILGSGNSADEAFFTEAMSRYDNLIFLQGYSESIANACYNIGDLFLMPSSFEPCGISQMLAMRAGQPCLVHAVGGLKDTVQDNINGFCFNGDSLTHQADQMIERLKDVLKLRKNKPKEWQKISVKTANTRFLWQESALNYIDKLYQPGH